HDPWYTGALPYTRRTVPGKWWKYRLDRFLARHLERVALRAADHIIAVSAGYADALSRRYSRLDPTIFTILPFAAAAEDYQFAREHGVTHQVFSHNARFVRWVYVGAMGPD